MRWQPYVESWTMDKHSSCEKRALKQLSRARTLDGHCLTFSACQALDPAVGTTILL